MGLDKILEKRPLRNLRTVVDTVNAIVFLGTALASVVTLGILAANQLTPDPVVATALVVLLVALLAATSYAWHFVTRIYNPTFYEILELEGSLRIELSNGHRRYQYVRRQKVEATRDDLRLIEFREHWTGKGTKGTTSVQSIWPDHVILDGRRAEEDGRIHRWIYPRRPLGRGQRVEVAVRQIHEDDVERQLPYFRQGGGRYKTHSVRVTTSFPLNYDPANLHGAIWNTGRPLRQTQVIGELDVHRVVDRPAGLVHYRIEVGRTSPHHSYGMYWTWPDSSSDDDE